MYTRIYTFIQFYIYMYTPYTQASPATVSSSSQLKKPHFDHKSPIFWNIHVYTYIYRRVPGQRRHPEPDHIYYMSFHEHMYIHIYIYVVTHVYISTCIHVHVYMYIPVQIYVYRRVPRRRRNAEPDHIPYRCLPVYRKQIHILHKTNSYVRHICRRVGGVAAQNLMMHIIDIYLYTWNKYTYHRKQIRMCTYIHICRRVPWRRRHATPSHIPYRCLPVYIKQIHILH